MQATMQANEDFKTKKYGINLVLSSIKDDIKKINKYCPNEDLSKMYDSVFQEAITDENIKMLYDSGKLDELTKTLTICEGMLSDLYFQISKSYKEKEKSNSELNIAKKNCNHHTEYYKPTYYFGIGEEIVKAVSLILSTAMLFGGIKLGTYVYTEGRYAPKTTEYYYDSEGGKSIETSHKFGSEAYIRIYEYSAADKAGYRTKKVYSLDPSLKVLSDGNSLLDIDLSTTTPDEEGLFYDEDINSISKDLFRTYEAVQIDKSDKAIAENITAVDYVVGVLLSSSIIALVGVITFLMNMIFENAFGTNCYEYVEFLIELIKYRSKLASLRKIMIEKKQEVSKYDNILNTSFEQVDKIIDTVCSKLSTGDQIKEVLREFEEQLQIVEKIRTSKELEKNVEDSEEKQALIMKQIEETAYSIAKVLSSLTEEEYKQYLHSIEIPEYLLFEKVEDNHYRIRECFKGLLPLFDLKDINFNNVEGHDIIFSKSNARIFPNGIYGRDLSHSEFDDDNVVDWANYNGVDIRGSKFEENPSTMVDLQSAITDEETTVRGLKIKA